MSDRSQHPILTPAAVAIIGPESAAELTPGSPQLYEAIEKLGKRVAGMTDEQIRAEFSASDGLVASLRELQATCGF